MYSDLEYLSHRIALYFLVSSNRGFPGVKKVLSSIKDFDADKYDAHQEVCEAIAKIYGFENPYDAADDLHVITKDIFGNQTDLMEYLGFDPDSLYSNPVDIPVLIKYAEAAAEFFLLTRVKQVFTNLVNRGEHIRLYSGDEFALKDFVALL